MLIPIQTLHSSPTGHFPASLHRKGKYYNIRKTGKNVAGIRTSSVRKDCEKMSAKEKDDDQSLVRNASDLSMVACILQQNFLHLPLPPNAPYLLKTNEVSLNLPDDPDFGEAFGKFCKQKAHQACEWNGRTKAYLLDTLLNALNFGEYPQYYLGASGPDANRFEKLLNSHLNYQLELTERIGRSNGVIESQKTPQNNFFFSLLDIDWKVAARFLNFLLMPSSLKMKGFALPMNHWTIPWMKKRFAHSSLAKQSRRTEYPKKSGRKPSKRLPPPNVNAAISDANLWPIEWPEDCYAQSWLINLEPQQRHSLDTQEPIMGNFINQLNPQLN
ncbi:hypothetical protein VP01_76g14 [Puccinia sorghi]|uniref:Uncharacterized protein n=1 Tax=Puccinia sorghi TaxID=27349 RepID=A0A0L6UBN7_9BASI|nr:hypothetical protein VP01_76g14 [Puccinia sorghi]